MGSSSKPSKKDAVRLDDHAEMGSESELTLRPAGTCYRAKARSRGVKGLQSQDTVVGKTSDIQDNHNIEMGVWVEHDWKVESSRKR